MAVFKVHTKVTLRSLMRKSKHDLAWEVFMLLEDNDNLQENIIACEKRGADRAGIIVALRSALQKINELEQQRIIGGSGGDFAGSQVNTICVEMLRKTDGIG